MQNFEEYFDSLSICRKANSGSLIIEFLNLVTNSKHFEILVYVNVKWRDQTKRNQVECLGFRGEKKRKKWGLNLKLIRYICTISSTYCQCKFGPNCLILQTYINRVGKKKRSFSFCLDPFKTIEKHKNNLHSHVWSLTLVVSNFEINIWMFSSWKYEI